MRDTQSSVLADLTNDLFGCTDKPVIHRVAQRPVILGCECGYDVLSDGAAFGRRQTRNLSSYTLHVAFSWSE